MKNSPGARTYLTIHWGRRNEWWIYGWNWNQYYEYIYADLSSKQTGLDVPLKEKLPWDTQTPGEPPRGIHSPLLRDLYWIYF